MNENSELLHVGKLILSIGEHKCVLRARCAGARRPRNTLAGSRQALPEYQSARQLSPPRAPAARPGLERARGIRRRKLGRRSRTRGLRSANPVTADLFPGRERRLRWPPKGPGRGRGWATWRTNRTGGPVQVQGGRDARTRPGAAAKPPGPALPACLPAAPSLHASSARNRRVL